MIITQPYEISILFRESNTNTVAHIVTTNVEHPAITRPLRHYEEQNMCTVTYVPVVKGNVVFFFCIWSAWQPLMTPLHSLICD